MEELKVELKASDVVESFEGKYPNLKKLNLDIDCNYKADPAKMLAPILPYVAGVTSFELYLKSLPSTTMSGKIFFPIAEFSQLETFSLTLEATVTYLDDFLEKLKAGCPKLRSVTLLGTGIDQDSLHILLTLPEVESLELNCISNFCTKRLPVMKHLTKLELDFDEKVWNIEKLCQAIRKMPVLESLTFSALDGFVEIRDTSRLVCEVIDAAIDQGKDVLVKSIFDEEECCKKLSVLRKDEESSSSESQVLELAIPIENEDKLFNKVEKFVQDEFKTHYVVIIEGEEKDEEESEVEGEEEDEEECEDEGEETE